MTPRSIRRAAERRAQKLARKEARLTASEPVEISEAQLAANRANAQFSTGPRTPEGKARSSANAVSTALTGRTVLLSSDDPARYQHHVEQYIKEFNPATERESVLVQSIADADWRLLRIPVLEMAIFKRGREQGIPELDTFLQYEKQLRNLHIQESRLRRHREKDLAELRQLQDDRITEEKQQLEDAAMLYTTAKHDGQSWDPADHGFDFSLDDVKAYLHGVRAAKLYRQSLKQAQAAA